MRKIHRESEVINFAQQRIKIIIDLVKHVVQIVIQNCEACNVNKM